MTFNDNINDQNVGLWNELKDRYDFKLIYSPREISWRVNTETNPIEIYTSNKTPNIPAFTHELLHVYIESKGMSTSKDILHSMCGHDSFQILTSKGLFAKIHNYCSHVKMFPYFKEMGFHENSFLFDRIKLAYLDYQLLRLTFSFKITLEYAVTKFIGHSIALFNDVELANKPRTLISLEKLRRLKPGLFKIIEDFNLQWRQSDSLDLAYFFVEFDNKLNNWLIENKIW